MQLLLAALSAGSLILPASAPTHPSAAPAARVAPLCDDAYLGVYVLPAEEGGAEVSRLMEGSPAAAAGIRPGDRILSLGGSAIDGPDALIAAVEARSAGETVEVVLRRGEDEVRVDVALGARDVSGTAYFVDPLLGQRFRLEGTAVRTSPVIPLTPPVASAWIPVAPPTDEPRTGAEDDLRRRLDDMRARMEERWAELAERLERYRDEHEPDGARRQRLEELQRELEASRHEQEQRMDELRAAIRAAEKPRAGQRDRWLDGARALRGVGPWGTAPPATAEEVRALHEEVRGLRRDIQELKELLGAR